MERCSRNTVIIIIIIIMEGNQETEIKVIHCIFVLDKATSMCYTLMQVGLFERYWEMNSSPNQNLNPFSSTGGRLGKQMC